MIPLLLVVALQCPDGSPPPCAARAPARTAPALSVAILSFDNRSRDTNDAYLAEGLADDIASRLGQVPRLTVTSRAMVRRLRDAATTPLPQIGRTLNSAYLVTGTVQSSGPRLRVSVELLQAANGVQSWTQTYDRSRADLLSVQSDIATAVAGAITGRLLPQERARLASRPTNNAEAYELFLRANAIYRSGNAGTVAIRASDMLERVVALDPTFVRAWTTLSEAHGFAWWIYADRTVARRERWRRATDRAVALAPDAPETHMAQGYWHYWGARDYVAARRHFEAALARDSMRADVWNALANIERRQGQWDASLQHRIHGMELEPDDPSEYLNMMQTLQLLRRFDEADHWLRRGLERAPDNAELWLSGALTSSLRGGSAEARVRFDRAMAIGGPELLLQTGGWLGYAAEMGGALIPRLTAALPLERLNLDALRMRRYALLGARDSARRVAAELRTMQEAMLAVYPDDPGYRAHLGVTQAVLGDTAAAVASVDRAVALMPVSLDAFEGSAMLMVRAEALLLAGRHGDAVTQLRGLLAIPSWVTASWLRQSPLFAPLRGRPDFEALIR